MTTLLNIIPPSSYKRQEIKIVIFPCKREKKSLQTNDRGWRKKNEDQSYESIKEIYRFRNQYILHHNFHGLYEKKGQHAV